MVRIIKEYNKNFGKYVYVIVVNGQKEFFEFTKADAVKKVRKIIKMEKERKNKMVRAGTKWFFKKNAVKAQKRLKNKGIETKIILTTKRNELEGKTKKAFLLKRKK